MQSQNETNRRNLTGKVFHLALAALAAIVVATPASMHAQAPSVVFSANANYLGASSSSGTKQDFGAPIDRISANKRGDVFFINNSSAPNLVMIPAGTNTQTVIASNFGANSNAVAVDPQGNLWAMNGNYGVVFIPVTAGVYPNGIDASKIKANCALPIATANTTPCVPPLNYGSLYFAALTDIAIDASGNFYGIDFNDNLTAYGSEYRILEFDAATLTATVVLDKLPAAGQSGRVAISINGDIFEADGTNVYYSAAGSGKATTLTGFATPAGISSDFGGNIYVTEESSFPNLCFNNSAPSTCGSITVLPNVGGTVNPADRYTIVYGANNTGTPNNSAAIDGFGTITWLGPYGGLDIWRNPLASLSFGAEAIGFYAGSQSLPLYFEKAGTFGSFKIVSNSGTSAPFAVTTNTCVAGQAYAAAPVPVNNSSSEPSCTVSVNFVATAVGPQAGTLFAYDNSGNLLATAYLSGIGSAPLLNIDPGTASAIGSGWKDPVAITVDAAGNTYVADSTTGSVYKNGSSTAIASGFSSPSGIVVDAVGDLYVADSGNNRVVEVPFNNSVYGTPITVFAGTSGPASLAIDASSNLYLADSGNSRVLFLAMAANLPVGSNTSPIGSGYKTPVGIATDSAGNVYISDSGTEEISQYNIERATLLPIVTGLVNPAGVAVDSGGNLYYADAGKRTITRVANVGGTVNASYSSILPTILANPSAIAVDSIGNVYAADAEDATVGVLNRNSGAVSFGPVVESKPSQIVPAILSNSGTAALTLGTPFETASGSFTADFTLDATSTCKSGASLAVGGSCTVESAFTPSIIGAESDTLSFASNGGGASLYLSGTGTGIINVTITGAASLVYGNDATYAVTATQDGTYVVNISGTASMESSVVVTGGKGSFTIPVLGVGQYTIGLGGTIGTASLSVTPATLYATAQSATREYGTANPVFQSTITGAVNGDSFVGSGTSTATITSGVGKYAIVPVAEGSAIANYTVVAVDGVLTVTQAQSNTVLFISTPGNGLLGTPVTFQANVTSLTSGVPTGTVIFKNVTASNDIITIGTATINAQGVATFTTSSLASGTIYVAAVYDGNLNLTGSTSASSGLTISLPTFKLTSTPQTLTIAQGKSGTATLTVTPVGNFTSAVVFSCQGMPLEATCSFASPSITPNGGPVTTTLTVNTTAPASANLKKPFPWGNMGGGTALALTCGFFFGWRRKRVMKGFYMFMLVALLGLVPLFGCGGLNEKNFDTPLGISNVTITGSSSANTTQVTTELRLAITTN